MDKSNKKDDRVTIRLSQDLQNYEAYGFKNISEYIKAALAEFNAKKEYEVIKTREILESISSLISIMEADRDYNGEFSDVKNDHLQALYNSAKILASSRLMMDSPINQIENLFDEDEPGSITYAFTWAL